MNTLNPLSRMRLAGKLCVVGAWATLALGFILIIIFYVLNNVDNGPNSGPGLGVTIFVALLIAMLAFFFFLVLYAIGAVLNYMSVSMSVSKNTDEEVATPPRTRNLPEEDDAQLEITPIQKTW
jgi:hypothetical protein